MTQQPADYRKRAKECVEIAQTAMTPAQRTMLLHIADTWLRLAKDAEEVQATLLSPATKPPRGPTLM